MAVIGIELESDAIVLTRGRDFEWSFANLDESRELADFEPGELYVELNTGGQHNAVQRVRVSGANAGTYKLGIGSGEVFWSDPIDFSDISDNPQGIPGDLQDAIDSVLGDGNGIVAKPSQLFPVWKVDLTLNAGHVLTEQLVNTINKAFNDFMNTFDTLLGVDIQFTIHDNLNMTSTLRSLKSYTEAGVITFVLDVTTTLITNFFNTISTLVGLFHVIHINFYWDHVYQFEFVGDLALTPQAALSVDTTDLDGIDPEDVSVTVEVVKPGKARLTKWPFAIDGAYANLKVESPDADAIQKRTKWQLVWLPEGEAAGGKPEALGLVRVQGE